MESTLKKLCRLVLMTLPEPPTGCRGTDGGAVLSSYAHLPRPMKLALQGGLLVLRGLLAFHTPCRDAHQARRFLQRLQHLPGSKPLLSFVINLLLLDRYSPQLDGLPMLSETPALTEFVDGEDCAVVVVGSGPGGLLAATLLAEAGREVVMVEAAPLRELSPQQAFSAGEIHSLYRNQGVGVALGRVPLAFIEPFCLGGGGEINSGLYHRPPQAVVEQWLQHSELKEFTWEGLNAFCRANEIELGVRSVANPPEASCLLGAAGEKLGWPVFETETWGVPEGAIPPGGTSRQGFRTARKVFLPRFLAAGGRLVSGVEVRNLRQSPNGWILSGRKSSGAKASLSARQLVLSAGSLQTPGILMRSGLGQGVGRRLMAHPVLKVIAHFPEPVNQPEKGISVHQLMPPDAGVVIDSGISTLPHLALGLSGYPEPLANLGSCWRNYAVFSVMLHAEALGRAFLLPGGGGPFVWYQLTNHDWDRLAEGLLLLGKALYQAGADRLFPCLNKGEALASPTLPDLTGRELKACAPALFSPHLTSTCPMGGSASSGVVDSWGRVWGHSNLWVADGSLLPTSPGVNPQGTIQALVRRNISMALERGWL